MENVTWDFEKGIDGTKGNARWGVMCRTVLVIFPWLARIFAQKLILGTRIHFAVIDEIIRNLGETELGESYAVDIFEPNNLGEFLKGSLVV
jgi:hypothetical protein